MPCPLFEPRTKVSPARVPAPRLPLIEEFEGICHAGETVIDPEHRFKFCNRGNAAGECRSFPPGLAISAVRFTVTRITPRTLSVLVVEEQNHWPSAWSRVDFIIDEQRLEPEINEVCRRAQVFHFCVSYLEKTK